MPASPTPQTASISSKVTQLTDKLPQTVCFLAQNHSPLWIDFPSASKADINSAISQSKVLQTTSKADDWNLCPRSISPEPGTATSSSCQFQGATAGTTDCNSVYKQFALLEWHLKWVELTVPESRLLKSLQTNHLHSRRHRVTAEGLGFLRSARDMLIRNQMQCVY